MSIIEDAVARLSDPVAMMEAALEIRARWHRAKDEYDKITGSQWGRDTQYVQGRMRGMETDLALILGVDSTDLHNMLMEEHVTVTPR